MNGQLHDLRRGDEPTEVEDFTAPFNTPRYQTESARKEVPISHKVLDPEASPFSRIQVTLSPESADRMECFVQFLARRQLITNKTERFDNHPENYNTSRATFKNMTWEVNITASDELALLVEYTTGESKQLSQRLRNAYAENPAATMREPWRKLGEQFRSHSGAPEQIDDISTQNLWGQQRIAGVRRHATLIAVCQARRRTEGV